jgi:hypothetical protein
MGRQAGTTEHLRRLGGRTEGIVSQARTAGNRLHQICGRPAKTCKQTMNGVAFDLSSTNEQRTDGTGLHAASMIVWQNVIAGNLTIHESALSGHAGPRVFCSTTPQEADKPSKVQEVASSGDAVQVSLNAGDEIDCDWFNIGDSGVSQVATMIIRTFACPDGFDASSSDLQSTGNACDTPLNSFVYQLVTQSTQYGQSSGDFEQGATYFYGVPANEGLTLVAKPTDGQTTGAVYCGQALNNDGAPAGFDRMDTTDTNTIFPSATPGAQTICLWFAQSAKVAANQPVNQDNSNAQPSQQNGVNQSADSGGIQIVNRVCPAGFDASNADFNTLDNNCNDNGNGYEFWLVTTDGPIQQNSGDNQDQSVVWTNLAPQSVAIQETISGNLSGPIVFCDGNQVNTSTDGVVTADVTAGSTVSCTWFTTQN